MRSSKIAAAESGTDNKTPGCGGGNYLNPIMKYKDDGTGNSGGDCRKWNNTDVETSGGDNLNNRDDGYIWNA